MTGAGAPTFDLQSHSIHSDGALPAADVVARAGAAGVTLLALTDHDTVAGVGEAVAAARAAGLRVVPAAEISALDGDYEDLHVLGYGIDPSARALADALAAFRADRAGRGHRMADALRELGWVLEVPDRGGAPVGRPHLAQAVWNEPANRERLRAEGLEDFSAFLVAYLIPGALGYRRRTMPTVADAVDVIHDAGGVAVWAHPFWDIDASREVLESIDRFAAAGMDGVEAFYVTHTREQTAVLVERCAERDLLTTGSADFHGPEHPHFSRFRAFDLFGFEPDLGPIPGMAHG
ncbi:MAG TPA: PHP domain-containing protein [Solirubrobacteraceae bacterium]|nr:PHP domain-containing protein [Solirubrobacteraceae bacterium]